MAGELEYLCNSVSVRMCRVRTETQNVQGKMQGSIGRDGTQGAWGCGERGFKGRVRIVRLTATDLKIYCGFNGTRDSVCKEVKGLGDGGYCGLWKKIESHGSKGDNRE